MTVKNATDFGPRHQHAMNQGPFTHAHDAKTARNRGAKPWPRTASESCALARWTTVCRKSRSFVIQEGGRSIIDQVIQEGRIWDALVLSNGRCISVPVKRETDSNVGRVTGHLSIFFLISQNTLHMKTHYYIWRSSLNSQRATSPSTVSSLNMQGVHITIH
jgi:hypothetical protein